MGETDSEAALVFVSTTTNKHLRGFSGEGRLRSEYLKAVSLKHHHERVPLRLKLYPYVKSPTLVGFCRVL